jgi:para-nitrobenzyl esterase
MLHRSLFAPLLAATVFSFCLATPVHASDDASVVATQTGRVRGVAHDDVLEWRGIAYAAPPTGARRFAMPEPATAWTGVRDATHYGSSCPQVSRYGLGGASENEDCLYLNITRPAAAARDGKPRPVFVWIHGGVFVGGSSTLYPLEELARTGDLVVVSLNYRLGAFGFMPHPSFPWAHNGSYGLEDQRAALRWIQANITAFGGDPSNVTIAGESAGAGSICTHLAAPTQTRGLFARAILQSAGCPWHLRTVREASNVGLAVAARVGCQDGNTALACLRRVPVAKLLAAQTEVAKADLLTFAPAVGTQTLPRQMADAIATGDFNQVPLLNGGTTDEMRLFLGYYEADGAKVTAENYPEALTAVYGFAAPRIAALYPLSKYSSPPAALGSVISDFLASNGINNCQFLRTAELAGQYVPVYEFEFADRDAPPVMDNPGFEMGAVHASELPYLFPHFDNTAHVAGPALAPGSGRLSRAMLEAWTSFAREGRPHSSALPAWPTYAGHATVMRLKPDESGLYDAAEAHHCRDWLWLFPGDLWIPLPRDAVAPSAKAVGSTP